MESCKSRQKAGGFPTGEASSQQYLDSQIVELKRELPEALVERTSKGSIKVTFDSGILFAVNSAALSPAAKLNISKLAGILNKYPETSVIIEGHTDITGTTEYNKTLSGRRAVSVKDYAVAQGVDPARIRTIGYGEARPVATNSTKKGQARNRRVEIIIML